MALEARGITKSYGDFSISLDLTVEGGETLALVGPSGSGKTTALSLIAGLGEMEAGQLLIDGEDLGALPAWKRNIAMVFQDLALFPHLDVGGNIAFGLLVRKTPKKERQSIIESTLELVRLSGYARRKIHTLSGGEKQRVAIARALASKPRALLLDEPFSSLDTPLRIEMRREFLDIRSRSQAPCIFVTHDREEAAMLGSRLALMSGGHIIETAPAQELFLAPKTEFAARFFASGQVLPCKITEKRSGGVEVSSPLGFVIVPSHSEPGVQKSKLYIPYDALSMEKPDKAGWKPFSAIFKSTLFEGSRLVMKFELASGEGKKFFDEAPETSQKESVMQFDVIVSPRTELPAPCSEVKVWVDQSLLRFVR